MQRLPNTDSRDLKSQSRWEWRLLTVKRWEEVCVLRWGAHVDLSLTSWRLCLGGTAAMTILFISLQGSRTRDILQRKSSDLKPYLSMWIFNRSFVELQHSGPRRTADLPPGFSAGRLFVNSPSHIRVNLLLQHSGHESCCT